MEERQSVSPHGKGLKENFKQTLRRKAAEKTPRGESAAEGKKGGAKSGALKALVGVLSARDAEKFTELSNGVCAALSYETEARGTARSTVLDYLGLGETEKKLVISLIPESAADAVMKQIRENMPLYLPGRGICFILPLSGASSIVANALKKSVPDAEKKGGKKVKKEREYSLLVTAMQKGFAEEAMEAARSAGAAGGTVLTSATLNDKKAEQLIGVTLQKETDILLILVKNDAKQAITQAILQKVGLKTDGGGVVFSLPVDDIAGVGDVGRFGAENASEKNAE
ncbi:MAG: hypothetical protein ACI4RO_03460 [Candidatus Scatosoma sp.]